MKKIDDIIAIACSKISDLKKMIEGSKENTQENRDFLMNARKRLHKIHVSFYHNSNQDEIQKKAEEFIKYLDEAIEFYKSYINSS